MGLIHFVNRWGGLKRILNRRRRLNAPWKIEYDETCTEEDVYNCFRLILGRNPSQTEWLGHRAHSGNKLADVVASYTSSLEFKRRRLGAVENSEIALIDLGDYKLYVSESDTEVGIHISRNKTYEPHVANNIEAALRPGMRFVDVGANIGFFSMLAASIVGPNGKVLAFEPYQYNVKLLYHSAQVNRFSNVEIFPFAVADRNQVFLYNNQASNGKIEPVSDISMSLSSKLIYAVKLDDFLKGEKLDIIKIDVEGAEYMVLAGAGNLLQKHQPIIFTEFSPPALRANSQVTAEAYLNLVLVNETYTISIIREDGQLIECRRNIAKVIKYFENAQTDHIDIIARPATGETL